MRSLVCAATRTAVMVFGLSLSGMPAFALPPGTVIPAGLPQPASPDGPPLAIAPSSPPSACAEEIRATEANAAKDRAVVASILSEAKARGFPALNARLDELRAVIDRAPVRELTNCDGARYMRGMGASNLLAALVGASGDAKSGAGKPRVVVLGPSPYPLAASLAGSTYLERKDYARADQVLKKGLALAPDDPALANEDALALSNLKRPLEGLAVVDRALGEAALLQAPIHAKLLRTKGYTLGEAGRYDEAIAAYQESLKLEPGNGLAQNEIVYLTKRKGGASPQSVVSYSGDQSKSVTPQN